LLWDLGTGVPQINCKLYDSDVIWKKAKQYFINLPFKDLFTKNKPQEQSRKFKNADVLQKF